MTSEPLKTQHRINLGEGFELDPSSDELYRAGRVFKLEPIPSTVLLLLVENRGQVVRREEIVEKVWGKSVFLDTDNSINSAIRKIRQALKDDPESPRFIQTISGRGYRFVGQVDATKTELNPQPTLVPPPIADSSSSVDPITPAISVDQKRPVTTSRVLLATIALVIMAATGWLFSRHAAKGTTHSPIHSLAVLPLKNLSGDPSQEYLADGMTEAIIGRLSAIHDLSVISRTSVMSFKDTKLSLPEIAGKLHVDALVEGSVIRDGNRIRVHAQLIRAATDEHFWSEEYDRELKDILALESDVAQSIASKVEVTITGKERERLTAARSVSPEVYENYLKGWFGNINTRADIERSVAYYEQAITRDPTFAPAYVGLAIAYDHLGDLEDAPPDEVRLKEMSAVRKALELDPGLATPHAYLAYSYQQQWQWAEAEAEYKRALELDPNDAAAHLGFANWLRCQARVEEALTLSERARALDPVGATGLSNGRILFNLRRYNDAIRELRSVIAVHPDYATAHWFLGSALIATGQLDEAITALKKAASLSDDSSALLGTLVRACAQAGNRKETRKLLDELERRRQDGYVPAAAFVEAYLGLGETDQAFAWLERAYQEHSIIMQELKVDPLFDPIRRDPRFVDLVHRVGLDKSY